MDSSDYIFGGNGNDIIYGAGNFDGLDGDAGDDRLFGGAGNDALSGGAGNDTLVAGLGIDQLTGGQGADVFGLEDQAGVGPAPASRSAALTSSSVIADFEKGTDKLDLTDAYSNFAAALADASDLGDGSGVYFARVNATVFGVLKANLAQADTTFTA